MPDPNCKACKGDGIGIFSGQCASCYPEPKLSEVVDGIAVGPECKFVPESDLQACGSLQQTRSGSVSCVEPFGHPGFCSDGYLAWSRHPSLLVNRRTLADRVQDLEDAHNALHEDFDTLRAAICHYVAAAESDDPTDGDYQNAWETLKGIANE